MATTSIAGERANCAEFLTKRVDFNHLKQQVQLLSGVLD
jgi:hypothetical protein